MVLDISGSVLPVFHHEASCILFFPSNSKVFSDLSLLSSSNPMGMQYHPPLHRVLCPFFHSQFLPFALHPSQMTSGITSACAIYWSASRVNTGVSLLVIFLAPDLSSNKINYKELQGKCAHNVEVFLFFFTALREK